ncbi:MAG: single-stranded-DNA-specific exonuclease RecJ [Firmicutes bacterium]|nr:single-stranded-DNA-specific exonuclease RecJ [Bacillota bacterium]
MAARRWRAIPAEPEKAGRIARLLGVSPLIGQLLLNRGLEDPDRAHRFLFPALEHLHPPALLPGLPQAVERLMAAFRREEKILIFGDYDVDGITATSLLVRLLQPLAKGGIYYYVPKRLEEGYGLSVEVMKKAARQGVKLILTVDCGITARAEVAYARELGMEVIVTDHHQPGEEIPAAAAVIDPKLPGSRYPFPELAGVGVAFKLALALAERGLVPKEELFRHLDLVALGTIADVVPLLDENRVLACYGLRQLNRTENPGLRALLEVTRLAEREVNAGHVGFILAPRLNATGRLGDASPGVKLLLTGNPERARSIARDLERDNQERQRLENKLLEEARARIAAEIDLERERAIVLAAAGWHPGVIGIVASRLVESFHRPVVLISLEGEEGRGSGRSIPGFNLYQGLATCAAHLERFGGHEAAAGLTIRSEKVEEFARAFTEMARTGIPPSLLEPTLRIEAEVGLAEADLALAREVARLAPYGPGNPAPVLACREVEVLDCRGVGEENKHLKLRVAQAGAVREGIGFNFGAAVAEVAASRTVDLAFTLEESSFNGTTDVQLCLRDLICRGG